jgi:hypothetical protein
MKKHKFRVWSIELDMMIDSSDLKFTYKNGEIVDVISALISLTTPLSNYVLEEYVNKNDEYGTEIFEGDVVYFIDCYEHDVVVWDDENFKYFFRESCEDLSEFKSSELRVVGNIHEMAKEL